MVKGNREKFLKKTKKGVQEALKSRDRVLSAVSKTIDELDDVINVLGERLEDWYVLYFPEFKHPDRLKYAKAVQILDKNVSSGELASLLNEKHLSELKSKSSSSLGADFGREDLEQCRGYARSITSLYDLRDSLIEYQKKLAQELCPNIVHVAGPEIAAKLVAHVGSLSRLSVLPASTIQVLGAEKALFKHLKNRKIDPPKHGIIFQHVYISSSPKKIRGKIARLLANKIALAAKADQFTKHFIAPDLKKQLDARYKDIIDAYSKNPGE